MELDPKKINGQTFSITTFSKKFRIASSKNNVSFTFIRIGVPLQEADFAKLEKKLKHPISKAVKEVYSIFRELRILWKYRLPQGYR